LLFVSKYRAYSFVGRHAVDRQRHLDTAEPVRAGIQCDFLHFGLPAWASKQALDAFGGVAGLGHDEDPAWRLSMYDTDLEAGRYGWSTETKREIEERLLSGPSIGVDYVLVEKPRLPAPWPAYDQVKAKGQKSVARVIADKVAEDGYDPRYVIDYEQENADRPEVVAALQELVDAPVEEEAEIVA
jgi:hypothetical protein